MEAEKHQGPSIVIAYSPCIAHGIKGGLANSMSQAKLATECGYWPTYRFDPKLLEEGKKIATATGYKGIYTQAQDNNLIACKFYLKTGFEIGGIDTMFYNGTAQEGKIDIIFYLNC